MTVPTDPPDTLSAATEVDDSAAVVLAERPPLRSSLPRRQSLVAWLVLTGVVVALDGGTGLVLSVGIGAALLAGVQPRVLSAAGVVCAALVPVWILSGGSVTTEDITPALVNESMVPHHLAFSALVLLTVSVILQAERAPHSEVSSAPPVPNAGPLGDSSSMVRRAVAVVSAMLALGICVFAAWQP